MPGKRPRPLHRTTSLSLLNFDALANQCSPLPEQHPIEKQKPGKGPVLLARRQVIGFAPSAFAETEIAEKKVASLPSPPAAKKVASLRPPPAAPPAAACHKTATPHSSGLCDLFSSARPCWKSDTPGIGLGIVAALEKKDEAPPRQVKGIGMDCHRQVAHQPSSSPPRTPTSSHPIPISGLKQHFENVALKHQAPPRSPRESYIGIMAAPGGQGRVEQEGHQMVSGVSLLAWGQSTDLLLEDGSKLFTSLSSTPVSKGTASAPSGFTALHFLDACYFCKRVFGEDRDIYMYRGDKAFCSVECRHHQMVQDDRLEKCSAAALSTGGITPARHISQRHRVMAVAAGTAAAA